MEQVAQHAGRGAPDVITLVWHRIEAAPDIGQFGEYVVYATYSATPGEKGTVEVYDVSERDGSDTDVVSIPVYFGNDRTVSVYFMNSERTGEGDTCSQVYPVDRYVFDTLTDDLASRTESHRLLARAFGLGG